MGDAIFYLPIEFIGEWQVGYWGMQGGPGQALWGLRALTRIMDS